MAAKPARKLTAADYTVGWICALPLELAASEGMLDRIHDAGSSLSLSEGDQNSYILGEIGGHNVVMACLPTGSMGQTSATTVAVDMMHSFPRIRFGLMVGIGGGAPDPSPSVRPDEDIRLGDVVVSIPSGEMGAVIKYDRGKVVAGGEFQHTGILNVPPSVLTTAVSVLQGRHETLMNAISRSVTDMIQKKHTADGANLASLKRYQHPGAEYDQLFEAGYEHVGSAGNATNIVGRPVRDGEKEDGEEEDDENEFENEFPCPHCDDECLVPRRPRRRKDPVIHYGPIASADMVMRHGATREKLRKKYGILCFEMEAAGLMNVFPCLVIRGICDYSDTHKNKLWQRYAAATAAAYGKELLGTIPRVKPIEPPRLDRAEDDPRKEQKPKHTELLEWLGPDTHSRKWADSRKKWHRGTGAVFLESLPFLNWTSNRTRTLWCRGIAGSGKTIFSSLVLDRLHAARKDSDLDQKAAVLCLYLEYERIQEQSLQALLAAVLRQLLQQCPEPPSSVNELHATLVANQSQPPLEEICSVVADAMRTFPDVYLVVDALDECPDDAARDLLSNLRELQQSTGLKLLATSRPTIDLGEFFDEYESLEIRAPELDVKAVLDSLMIKLPKLVREDKRLQEKIKDSIAEAVDGMFILVEPFLYSLRSERTVGDINDALRGLLESPDKIAMVYERTLRRIDDHPVKDQQMAHRILAWVLLAKRPLSCREFQHALSVRVGEDFDKDYFAGNLEDAVGLCAGLVVINHESDTVQLMHHTARNYFKATATQLDWISHAGSTIAAACVTYLSFSAFSAGPCPSDEALSARLQDFPFLDYAAQQWGNHLRESDGETMAPPTRSNSQAEELAVQFLREESNVWSAHQVLHMPAYGYPGYSQHFIREANGLQLAASFGLCGVVRRLLAGGADIAATDGDGGTALHRAAENGHVDVVLLLLRHDAVRIDIRKTKHRHTAMHLAALNGHAGVVEALLHHGACATLRDDEGWTALHVAAWTGKKDVVEVLLEGMDVHARGKDGVTALHCAAGQGQRAVAELLIARGANVNIVDSYGWTALHWASKKRHDLAKLRRLEFKEKSTSWGEQLKTVTKVTGLLRDTFNLPKKLAMMGKRAARPDHHHNWQDDLAYAADGLALDLNTNNRGTLAMLYFSTRVDRLVPPWLLPKQEEEDQIADVRLILAVQDELGALQCLVQCGHRAVAELLLENGAAIDAKCQAVVASKFQLKMSARPTALHMAGLSGHEPMARLLLDGDAEIESLCELGIGEDWLGAKLTALHCAVISGSESAVRVFLDKGSDANAICHVALKNLKARITALHLAIIWGHVGVAKLLLNHGADAAIPCYINVDNSARTQRMPYAELSFAPDTDLEVPVIHLTSILGNKAMLREIVKQKADCEALLQGSFDSFNFRLGALHVVTLLGQLDAIDMLHTYGASANAKAALDVGGITRLRVSALQLATLCKSADVVSKLLGQGANVHAKGRLVSGKYAQVEWTVLHCAALQGDAAVIRKLIEAGAEVDIKLQGQVAICVPLTAEAIIEQAARMFAALLGEELVPSSRQASNTDEPRGRDREPERRATFELQALDLAALSKDEKKVEALLDCGADPNRTCTVQANDLILEATPLHLAIIWQCTNTALRLLDAGAGVDTKFRIVVGGLFHLEMFPLHLAALVGDPAVATELITRGAANIQALLCIANARVELFPIHLAAISGDPAVTNMLLLQGSSVDMQCGIRLPSASIGMTPLHLAAALKRRSLLDTLLVNGADVNRQVQVENMDGDCCITPLHLLLFMGREGISHSTMRLFLDNGADASAPFQVDFSPQLRCKLSALHLAAMAGDWSAVRRLLKRGANAATQGSVTIFNMHLKFSALHFAALWGWDSLVRNLIKNGADPDDPCCLTFGSWSVAKITLSHLAAFNQNAGLLERLIQKGATAHLPGKPLDSTNAQNTVSPLHVALLMFYFHTIYFFWNAGTVRMLVEHGASVLDDLRIRTEKSRIVLSVLALAAVSRDLSLTKLLVRSGADVNATSAIQIRNVEVQFTPLTLAALLGQQDRLVYLLKHGADVHQVLKIRVGHCSMQLPPLHIATRLKTRKLARVLLKYKADPHAYAQITGDGWCISWTAIHWAAALHEEPTVAELLLKNGARIHDKLKLRLFNLDAELHGLHLAIARGSDAMVNIFLAVGGGSEDTALRLTVDSLATQLSALHVALLLKRGSLVKRLIAEGVDLSAPYTVAVRKQFQAEISALHLSTLSGEDGLLSFLEGQLDDIHAKCWASINMTLQFELKIADVITVFGTRDVMEPLVEHEHEMEDQVYTQDSAGMNLALYLATALGWESGLRLLLERADDVDQHLTVKIQAVVDAAPAFDGYSAAAAAAHDSAIELDIETDISVFHLATVLGNTAVARLLLSKGAHIDAPCHMRAKGGLEANFTPLMLAATWRHDGTARLLLEKGATVSQVGQAKIERTIDSTTAVRNISVMLGDKRVGQVLKDVDSIRGRIRADLTALHLAVLLGDIKIVKLLLEHGEADPDMVCLVYVEADNPDCFRADFNVRLTPLHLAAWTGHEEVAALLLDRGAKVNERIQAGGTATLRSGAKINEEMQARGTALHIAAGLGKEGVVRILREHGADMAARTRDGRTALQWADDHGGVVAALTGIMTGFIRRVWGTFYDTGDGKNKKPTNGG